MPLFKPTKMIYLLPVAEAALEPRENVLAKQKCQFEQCTRDNKRESSVESRLVLKYELGRPAGMCKRAWVAGTQDGPLLFY